MERANAYESCNLSIYLTANYLVTNLICLIQGWFIKVRDKNQTVAFNAKREKTEKNWCYVMLNDHNNVQDCRN